MFNESRIDIYNFLYGLFYDTVTRNVYKMGEPTENTESDTTDGFITLEVGTISDDSEFSGDAYGWARCFVTAYVPKKSRGRLDDVKYKAFEDGINTVVKLASESSDADYYVLSGSELSIDDVETTQKGNQYHIYQKSFIVVIDKQIE
jgi:hypothetical protein